MPQTTWQDSESVSESERQVIAFLAENPKQTPYKIEIGTGLAHSTVDRVFRGKIKFVNSTEPSDCNLMSKSLVFVVKESKFRNTGTNRKEYSLTFKGLMLYFASIHTKKTLQSNTKNNNQYAQVMDKILFNYARYHQIFEHWKELINSLEFSPNIGGGLHGILPIICNLTYHQPFNTFPDGCNWDAFRYQYPMAYWGLEGFFTFQFLGWLANDHKRGWLKIKAPIEPIFNDWMNMERKLQETTALIHQFAQNLSPVKMSFPVK